MGTTLDLISIDEKKTKINNNAKAIIMSMVGLTLTLKYIDNENIKLYGLIIGFLALPILLYFIFGIKPYNKTGKIIVGDEYIIIEENKEIKKISYQGVKKVNINFCTDKNGFKPISEVAQYGKNKIEIINNDNKKDTYSFLINYDATGRVLYKLKKELSSKYKHVKIENVCHI